MHIATEGPNLESVNNYGKLSNRRIRLYMFNEPNLLGGREGGKGNADWKGHPPSTLPSMKTLSLYPATSNFILGHSQLHLFC